MKYRIGFDIGIKSVGYAVLENDPITEEPIKIVDLGVRTFDANEVDKTGESSAKDRRILRGARRRRRRKDFRLERMEKLLNKTFSINFSEYKNSLINVDVYALRAKALDDSISDAEICKIVLNLLKRRGFKSNRKSITKDKEEGKLKLAISKNQTLISEKCYRTIGEAIYKDPKFKTEINGRIVYDVRNHNGSYDNCFYRDDLKNELVLILQSQQKFGNSNITSEFIEKATEIFMSQRTFDVGPGGNSPYKAKFAVGNCTFLEGEKRAPKSSLTFERFNALSKLNSLRINDENLTEEQRKLLLEKIDNCVNIKFSQIRNWFNLDYSQTFNLCNYYIKDKNLEHLSTEEIIDKLENKEFIKFTSTIEIRKALSITSPLGHQELFDEISLMLSLCKSDTTIDEYISNHEILSSLSIEQIDAIKGLNFEKFGNLSIKAMKLIIPFLIEGHTYDKACALAGINHSSQSYEKLKYLKGIRLEERLKDINTPTVKRAINQTLRILNQIIEKYGSPQFVTIELARDFAKTPNERKKIEQSQLTRFNENQSWLDIIKQYKVKPTGVDILKMRLYEEQNHKCMYSGDTIELEKLFIDNFYQIDHAIPISRSLDDSYNNKVLVKTSENQKKSDLIPYEYFMKYKTSEDWDNYLARVNILNNIKKRKILLTNSFSENRTLDYIDRNSNDTRYICRLLYNLMKDLLLTEPSKHHKKVVKCINGGITSYLRKCWGINKIREDGDAHHCIDACVIATATDGQVQKITRFNKYKEKYIYKNNLIIDASNGEVVDTSSLKQRELEELENLSKILPRPYDNFVNELKLRATVKYDGSGYTDAEKDEFRKIGYLEEEIRNLKPLFVSRMKSVKKTGAIHKETMYSTKEFNKTKMLIKTVVLSKLNISDKPERIKIKGDKHPEKSIDGYYRPLDDRKLYLMLKESLISDSKCFKNVPMVYKPSKNGIQGMPVKSVKKYEYVSNFVPINGGAFENNKMYRLDIFTKNGKNFAIPVYMKDVYAHKLPNQIVMRDKPWIPLDDSYKFKFSLYQNDLIKIKWNKEAKLSKVNKNEASQKLDNIMIEEGFFYYNSFNISNASIEIFTHDRCYSLSGAGIQNLATFEKYHVNIMGEIYKAPDEMRKEI